MLEALLTGLDSIFELQVLLFLGLGIFIGIWLGGVLFDYTGSYDIVWWTAVGLGVAAAIIHYPIDERAISRTVPAAAAGASAP